LGRRLCVAEVLLVVLDGLSPGVLLEEFGGPAIDRVTQRCGLRDRGVEALWSDPYCQNLLAVGFEYTSEKADLVTAFEAFEHFVDPLLEAEKLFAIAPNVLISTSLIDTPTPLPHEWWYYGLDHGQHIGFFRVKTLEFMAKRYGKCLTTDGVGCHLFTDKPVNLTRWKWTMRLARRVPSLFGRNLQSKIWSDFEKMSGRV
jgi:hypothetical protein